jgi:hypothetical protein
MRRILVLASLFLAAGCGDAGDNKVEAQMQEPVEIDFVQTWGAGVGDGEMTAVSDILAHPEKYVDQTVRVEGTAVAVCEHRGCWFEIASDVEGDTLRFKVADGEMVFPLEIKGETIRAEGVFTANELDLETTKQVCESRAEEAGEAFDPESVTECMTVYQISGTGAVQLAAQ